MVVSVDANGVRGKTGLLARNHVVVAAAQDVDSHVVGQTKITMIA